MAAYRATGNFRYLRYARRWGQRNGFTLNGGVSTRNADTENAGQAYFDLHDIDHDPAYVSAITESLRRMTYGAGSPDTDWTWVDALHMAMPCFVRVASYLGDDAYLNKLFALYRYPKQQLGLYDTTDGLWYRDSKYVWPGGSLSHSPNGAKVYWSRGNGWAIAAHAKVLGLLPAGDTRWPEYGSTLVAMARALLPIQRSDGFWNVNLADPLHLPGPETSGNAFFTFGLAYGIRAGLLDATTYLPVIANAWNGLVSIAVHPNSFLGYVQGTGERPESSQPVTYNSTSDFGVGAFLLAGTEVAKLAV